MIKNKIIKENDLIVLRKKTKNKIILAHGTYDFFHYGHFRHLKKAKERADLLVVSLTADKYIKKGPGRPIYNQKKRAEIISSLDFVDHVVIVNSFSGVEVINLLKPDYYSKGADYIDKSKDFTSKITMEEKAIPRKNYDILNEDNEIIGVVTSGTMSPTLNIGIGLGYVKVEYSKPRMEIFIQIRKNIKKALVVKPPFK